MVEIQQLQKYYDTNGDGFITYDEFLAGLRESLSARKQNIVDIVFRKFTTDKSGKIAVKDLANSFNAKSIGEVAAGKKSPDTAWNEFINALAPQGSSVTREEWNAYYTDLAMGIPNDEYFVRALEATWGATEDDQSTIFQNEVKRLLNMMRQRLLTITNKSYEEFTLRSIFKQFDLNNSGTITLDELGAMLAKLGISVDKKYIVAMLKRLDSNGTGVLEFEEFANLLINDPYK